MSEKQVLNKISEEIIAMSASRAVLGVPGVNHLSDNLKIINIKVNAVNIHVQGVSLPKKFRRNNE